MPSTFDLKSPCDGCRPRSSRASLGRITNGPRECATSRDEVLDDVRYWHSADISSGSRNVWF
jgi:hypothetical protein